MKSKIQNLSSLVEMFRWLFFVAAAILGVESETGSVPPPAASHQVFDLSSRSRFLLQATEEEGGEGVDDADQDEGDTPQENDHTDDHDNDDEPVKAETSSPPENAQSVKKIEKLRSKFVFFHFCAVAEGSDALGFHFLVC